jgi:hypothetical protein
LQIGQGADFAMDILVTENRYVYSNGSDLKNKALKRAILREKGRDSEHNKVVSSWPL